MWEKRSPHSRVPSTLQKLCQWFYLVPEKNTYICIYFIFQSAAYHRVFFPKYQFVISICHLHSLHRSHCNIDFDRVVLISDFYARISKNGCLNKTRTFPITIFCISLTNIFSGLFHSDSNSVDCSEKQGNSEQKTQFCTHSVHKNI